jgi:phage gp45-like
LKERNDIPREIANAALSAYRGYMTSTNEEDVTGGKLTHCTAVGRNSEVLSNVPVCRPYGLDSRPPQGTELIFLETQAGLIVVTERYRRPTLTDGQVTLYDENNAQIKLTNNTGATRRVEIGKGGTMKDAARKTDPVDMNASLITWMGQVETWINGVLPGTVVPLSTTFSTIGTISSGSTTVGIED